MQQKPGATRVETVERVVERVVTEERPVTVVATQTVVQTVTVQAPPVTVTAGPITLTVTLPLPITRP